MAYGAGGQVAGISVIAGDGVWRMALAAAAAAAGGMAVAAWHQRNGGRSMAHSIAPWQANISSAQRAYKKTRGATTAQ